MALTDAQREAIREAIRASNTATFDALVEAMAQAMWGREIVEAHYGFRPIDLPTIRGLARDKADRLLQALDERGVYLTRERETKDE